MTFADRLGLTIPLIQAPMAGVSTLDLAAAVSNAGGLGSIALGAIDPATAHAWIAELRARTDRPFLVNLFVHPTARHDAAVEADWLAWLTPRFAAFDATPPTALRTLYRSFADDPAMLDVLLDTAPPVVSFHFGLPKADVITALRDRGILLMATATNIAEARRCAVAGIDAIVAQGMEAGGHRGMFDPAAQDDMLGTMALTRLLAKRIDRPVIAAGGIMDGAGIAAALRLGAAAAQLGTAFIACPESAADATYRARLTGPGAWHTRMTSLISGRPARSLASHFTALEDMADRPTIPPYPIAYDAGKALNAAARANDDDGYGAYWAGQGAPLSRAIPAAALVDALRAELAAASH